MDRYRLVSLLEDGLSIDAIAAEVARSPSTVSYWLKRHGLKANGGRKYGPKPALDRDSLASLVGRGLSVPAIASELGCPPSRVRYWLGRHSLETRQSRNRAAARAAFGEGQRIVERAAVGMAKPTTSWRAEEAIAAPGAERSRWPSIGGE